MALADLAKLGVRKLVVDVDDAARTIVVRRLLLRFLLKQGFKATGQTHLSEPDAKDGWISAKHDELGTLHVKPRTIVVDGAGAELRYEIDDDTARSKSDAARACATAAAGALLLLFTGGTFGKGVVLRGAMGAAKASARMTEATAWTGASDLVARVDVDVTVLRELLDRHGGKVELICEGRGSDLVVGGGPLTKEDVRAAVKALEAHAKELIGARGA